MGLVCGVGMCVLKGEKGLYAGADYGFLNTMISLCVLS